MWFTRWQTLKYSDPAASFPTWKQSSFDQWPNSHRPADGKVDIVPMLEKNKTEAVLQHSDNYRLGTICCGDIVDSL